MPPPLYRARLGGFGSAIIRTTTDDGRVVYKAATPVKTYRKKEAPPGEEWAELRFLSTRDLAILESFVRDLRHQLEELDRREKGAGVHLYAPRTPTRKLSSGALDMAREAHDAVVAGIVEAAVARRSARREALGEPAAEGLAGAGNLEAGGVEAVGHEEGGDVVR